MLSVVRFLKCYNGSLYAALEALREQYGVNSKVYPESSVMILKYSGVGHRDIRDHAIVRECRGLILDTNTGEVLSRKFDRFFNYGEKEAPSVREFDSENSYVTSKEDGTCIGIWYHKTTGKWNISTNGTAFGEMPSSCDRNKTWAEMVMRAMNLDDILDETCLFQKFCERKFKHEFTYIFEYCGPENQIVTKYNESKMIFLGARENKSGRFLKFGDLYHLYVKTFLQDEHTRHNICALDRYQFSSIDEIKRVLSKMEDSKSDEEGFVIVNEATGVRMKMKSKFYVQLHHLRSEVPNISSIIKLIVNGEEEEFYAYFPGLKTLIEEPKKKIMSELNMLDEIWMSVKNIKSRKEYAMTINRLLPGHSLQFLMFKSYEMYSYPSAIYERTREDNKEKLIVALKKIL